MNSRTKGKVGEREFAALLRDNGFDARRGQQFSGSPESPDVVSEALAWLHVEVKRVQALNLADACAQAEGDCGGKPWIVAHRKNHAPWLITMTAETFFRLLRGDFPQPQMDTDKPGSAENTDLTTTSPDLSPKGGEEPRISNVEASRDGEQSVQKTEQENQ